MEVVADLNESGCYTLDSLEADTTYAIRLILSPPTDNASHGNESMSHFSNHTLITMSSHGTGGIGRGPSTPRGGGGGGTKASQLSPRIDEDEDGDGINTLGESSEEGGEGPMIVEGPLLIIRTLSETPFVLDSEAMGPNLSISNGQLTLRNMVNKKWNSCRVAVSFSSGVHAWSVHIDRCTSKNIFLGICTAEANLDNYIGSDKNGWGFLANKVR